MEKRCQGKEKGLVSEYWGSMWDTVTCSRPTHYKGGIQAGRIQWGDAIPSNNVCLRVCEQQLG